MVPLAYILDDKELITKAQKWVEWSIVNQKDNVYFGPMPLPEGYEKIPGTQQGMRKDWWPKMLMLKVLQQYYTATNDERVIELMLRYFKYQFETLPEMELVFIRIGLIAGEEIIYKSFTGFIILQVTNWFVLCFQ